MSRTDDTRHEGTTTESMPPSAQDPPAVDSKRRRALIKASLLSVPTIMTVTARPSFAVSNTSGHGSPCNPQVHVCDNTVGPAGLPDSLQAPSGLRSATGGNSGNMRAPGGLNSP